jgi:hypothetical protein
MRPGNKAGSGIGAAAAVFRTLFRALLGRSLGCYLEHFRAFLAGRIGVYMTIWVQ